MKSRLLLIVFFAIIAKTANTQTIYYSLNGATNPNLTNSWTLDNSGATLLLPPSNFSNPSDVFIIDGESMNISNNWTVAGEIRVENGALNNYDYYKFRAKKLVINNDKSGMHINDNDDVIISTLQIGPNGWFSTANIGSGIAIQIDDSVVIQGKLSILSPMIGSGKFILKDGATLESTNGAISKTGSNGNIQVTGSRFYSKLAKYHFISSVGNFVTGDALPDSVAELFIDYYQSSTTLSSSTTVTGIFSSSGAWGSSSNNNSINLGSSKLKCLGNLIINGNVTISGNSNSALILSGNNTSTITIPAITVDSFVLDRPATLSLNGNLSVLSKLNLEQGTIRTNSYIVQLGTSSEGKAYSSSGWIVGTFAVFKDKTNVNPLLFPVGGNNYAAPLTITYSAPPTSDGLIKISFVEGTSTSELNPSLVDGASQIENYSNFYWKVEPVLISGGIFDVSLNSKDIPGLTNTINSTLLISDIGRSQFYIKGDRSTGSDILINRSNITGSNTFERYYIGGTNSFLTVSPSTLKIAAQANSTKTFDITSNKNWIAASDQSWLTLNTTSGSNNTTITLTTTANPSAATRTATVTVAGTGVTSQTISITQEGDTPTLSVSTSTLTIAAQANITKTFDITSNTNWNVTSDQSWLTINTASGSNNATITLTSTANPSASTRTATVTVAGTGVTSQTISITQERATPTLSVSTSTLTIAAQANSTKTFDITSNTNWTVTSDQSWLTLNNASGSNNATITLTATANPSATTRKATITIAGNNLSSKLVSVTQESGTTRIVEAQNTKISIFPNPAVTVLYINGLTKNSSVSIVDLQGKTVISKQITNDQVNVESLSKGVYLIRITNGNEAIIRKFLKQ